jgi:hypothetical protein
MLEADPNREIALNDKDEPSDAKRKTDIAEANRENVRKDTLLPNDKKSRTENPCPPKLAPPA